MDDVASKLGDDFVKIGEDGTYAFDLTGDKIQQVQMHLEQLQIS